VLAFSAQEILERVKQRLRRTASDFLSEPEYLSLIDVAWRRCYNRTCRKFPNYYPADATIAITGGVASYPLPVGFRSLVACMIKNDGSGTYRPVRPLTEINLEGVTAVQSAAEAFLRYVPEPTRITAVGSVMSLPVAADEWIVNAVCRMVITKEGTDRQAFDMDFAMLDAELETYVGDFDVGWPMEINETFPADSWGVSDLPAIMSNLVCGYILRGATIEFWAWRAPGF